MPAGGAHAQRRRTASAFAPHAAARRPGGGTTHSAGRASLPADGSTYDGVMCPPSSAQPASQGNAARRALQSAAASPSPQSSPAAAHASAQETPGSAGRNEAPSGKDGVPGRGGVCGRPPGAKQKCAADMYSFSCAVDAPVGRHAPAQ